MHRKKINWFYQLWLKKNWNKVLGRGGFERQKFEKLDQKSFLEQFTILRIKSTLIPAILFFYIEKSYFSNSSTKLVTSKNHLLASLYLLTIISEPINTMAEGYLRYNMGISLFHWGNITICAYNHPAVIPDSERDRYHVHSNEPICFWHTIHFHSDEDIQIIQPDECYL